MSSTSTHTLSVSQIINAKQDIDFELQDQTAIPDDDGGLFPADSQRGWVVIIGSFFLLMITIGSTNSFGVYVQEYHTNVFPTTPTSTLSWIGSLQFGCMCFFGVGAGVLVERIGVKPVTAVGSVVSGVAFLAASACSTPVALIFTQGILFGAGGSCIMVPAISLAGQWMKKYRAIATGVAVSGGSIGGLWMSFATRSMVSKISWQWSLRITGIMIIVVGLAVTPLMKMRVVVQKRDKIIDFASLKNVKFVLLFGASLFATGGYFMPYYFMPSFAVVSLGLEPSWGANISSLLNAGSILGRIVTGVWADRVGPLNALFTTSLLSTLAILVLWLPFHHIGTLIASALIFGFTSGSVVSLVPVVTANIFGIKRLPSILGLLLLSYTIGTFVCSPVGAVLLDKYGHSTDYDSLIIYGGVFFGIGTLLLGVLRLSLERKISYRI